MSAMDESRLLEELSRMNNELVNQRHEGVRVATELERKDRFLRRVLGLYPDIIYVLELGSGRKEAKRGHGEKKAGLPRKTGPWCL